MLAEREEEKLLAVIEELLAQDADNVQALRLLVRAHWWQRDMDKLKASLERMAEASQAAGLDADERYALTQLARLAPDQTQILDRLAALGGAEESASSEVLPEFVASSGPSSESVDSTTTQFVFETEMSGAAAN